jgi:hypothetical protein
MNSANRSPLRPIRLSPLSRPLQSPMLFTTIQIQGINDSSCRHHITDIPLEQDSSQAFAPCWTPDLPIEVEEESLFPSLLQTKSSPASRLRQPQWKSYFAALHSHKEGFPLRNEAIRGAFQADLPVLRNSRRVMYERAQSIPKKLVKSPDSPIGKAIPASLPLCISSKRTRNRSQMGSKPVRREKRRETERFDEQNILKRTVTRLK